MFIKDLIYSFSLFWEGVRLFFFLKSGLSITLSNQWAILFVLTEPVKVIDNFFRMIFYQINWWKTVENITYKRCSTIFPISECRKITDWSQLVTKYIMFLYHIIRKGILYEPSFIKLSGLIRRNLQMKFIITTMYFGSKNLC